jgi:hypothetical protein
MRTSSFCLEVLWRRMSEQSTTVATAGPAPEISPSESSPPASPSTPPPQFWLRVHGYPPVPIHSFPTTLETEVVYYGDFYDPRIGRLSSDPRHHLREGDVLIYYADGGAVLYGLATVSGPVEGPLTDERRGHIWRVPIRRDAMIKTVNKTPHAVWLEPPSGWHFLRAVRDYTYIRLPTEDGQYYAELIRSRAGGKE